MHGRAELGERMASVCAVRSQPQRSPVLTSSLLPCQPCALAPLRCRCCTAQVLSTGLHTLADVRCRSCCITLGWQYLAADEPEQQYKVGAFLLQQAALGGPMQHAQEWEGEQEQSPTPPQLAPVQR